VFNHGENLANLSSFIITMMMRERRSRETQVDANVGTPTAAKVYEEHSLRELRAAGFRITMPRVQVIRALADTSKALSAYAIHEKIISGGGKIDVVSVYRILSTLQEVGLIHHIGIVDGYFPCRIPDCRCGFRPSSSRRNARGHGRRPH